MTSKTKMKVLEYIIATTGLFLIVTSIGWKAGIGVFLLIWANNFDLVKKE